MSIMDGARLANGSRARVDGRGDPWAQAHREALGKYAYMDDLDCFVWYEHSEDGVFMEYQPDAFTEDNHRQRRFGLVAIFDRKATWPGAELPRAILSSGFQRHICRTFARVQPEGCKPQCFLVVGPVAGPWEMVRLNLRTGEYERRWELPSRNWPSWQQAWTAAGVTQARDALRHWLMRPS